LSEKEDVGLPEGTRDKASDGDDVGSSVDGEGDGLFVELRLGISDGA